MTAPPDPYCRTCQHALDIWDDETGRHYRHTASYQGPPHDPDPRPLAEFTKVVMVCDFCSRKPRWQLQFADLTTVMHTPDTVFETHSGKDWAACHQCMLLVDTGDVRGLARRAVTFLPEKIDRRFAREHLEELYGRLLPTYASKEPLRWPQ